MRNHLSIILLMLLASACQSPAPQDRDHSGLAHDAETNEHHATASASDGIFIHLSSGTESPHRVGMALKMAEVMSDDKDVAMYLDINAVNLVVSDAPNVEHEGFTASVEQIGKLLEKGVLIQACPTCLMIAGYTEADLREGVVLADKEKFFNFTSGRILTIDY